jgi:hypothetical protein
MAKGKGGPPKVGDLSTRILVGIRDELHRLNARVDVGFAGLNDRLDQTNGRLDETNARLDRTISRLDNLRDVAGDTIRELEARIRILEARVLG